MPVLNFSFKRNFDELIGLNFTNPQLQNYKIKEMYERLDLKVTK